MFLKNSRYVNVATVHVTLPGGATVAALKLRHLTPLAGAPHGVQHGDRLDLLAQRVNGDATQFWHVADANSALDSRTLVDEPGSTILLPKA